jgi:hypothetical protein
MKSLQSILVFALGVALPLSAQQPPPALTAERLHQEAIREKMGLDLKVKEPSKDKEVIQELYAVMDSFLAKDIEKLSRHIHPQMLEFDSMSPYREIGKASFLEHMAHFFSSPQHIEDHFMRIKDPLVQMYGDNVAVVSFHYDTEASVGGQFTQNWGKASFVFVKDRSLSADLASTWLLAVCHYSTIRPSLR